jgi:hypothetical protein
MTIARLEKIASRKRRTMRDESRMFASASRLSFRGALSAHLSDVAAGSVTGFKLATVDCQTRGYAWGLASRHGSR